MRHVGILALLLACACSARAPGEPVPATTPGKMVLARFEGAVDGATGIMTMRQVAEPGGRSALLAPIPEGPTTVQLSNDAAANLPDLPAPKADACGAGLTGYKGYVKVQSRYATSNLQDLAVVIDSVSPFHEPCNASAYGGGYFFNYGSINSGQSATRAWIFTFTTAASFTFSGHVEGTVEGLPILSTHLGNSSFAIDGGQRLYSWGYNSEGELGLGDEAPRSNATQVGSDTNWAAIAPGSYHTLAIKNDGSLWAWGSNEQGQLGAPAPDTCGGITCAKSPIAVGADTDWASVSAGAYHTLAIKKDGTLWAWGSNFFGQLGLGDRTNRDVPTRVGTRTDWASVSAGYGYSMAVATNGEIWAWGWNAYGQLGLGAGDVADRSSPARVGDVNTWASVAAGGAHTLAIRRDGTLWGWGQDGFHQAGYAPTEECSGAWCSSFPIQVGSSTAWTSVVAGGYHSLALQSNGTLWGWGYDENAEVGMSPVGTCPYGLCVDAPTQIGTGTTWVSTAAGWDHSLGSQVESTLFCWGLNWEGQCGQGNTSSPVSTPTNVYLTP